MILPSLRTLLALFQGAPIGEAEAICNEARRLVHLHHFAGGSIADGPVEADAADTVRLVASTAMKEARCVFDAADELLRDLVVTLYVSAYGDPSPTLTPSFPPAYVSEARRYAVQPDLAAFADVASSHRDRTALRQSARASQRPASTCEVPMDSDRLLAIVAGLDVSEATKARLRAEIAVGSIRDADRLEAFVSARVTRR